MFSGDIKKLIENQSNIPMNMYVKIKIIGKMWGKKNNLIVKALHKDIEFIFNVYNNNGYKPRDSSVCFKLDETMNKEFICLFQKTQKGYIDIKEAKPAQ